MLRNMGLNVKEEFWPFMLKFAEKDHEIDYKFMLDVYKDRIKRIDIQPRTVNVQWDASFSISSYLI